MFKSEMNFWLKPTFLIRTLMVISDMIRAIIYWMFDISICKGPGTSSECENLGGQTEASLKLSPTFTGKV